MEEIGAGFKVVLGTLPQAHTCDNLLELPDYWDALCTKHGLPVDTHGEAAVAVVAELEACLHSRFQMAVNECDAYGLDEAADGAGLADRAFAMARPGAHAQRSGCEPSAGRSSAEDAFNAAVGRAPGMCSGCQVSTQAAQQQQQPQWARQHPSGARDDDDDDLMLETLLADTAHIGVEPDPPPATRRAAAAPQALAQPRPAASTTATSASSAAATAATQSLVTIEALEREVMGEATAEVVDLITELGGVDDLITELGVGSTLAESSSSARPRLTTTDLRPGPPALDRGDSKVTSSGVELDLDLELESLDLL